MSEALLTHPELARFLQVSERTVARLVREGLPRIHVTGRLYRYDLDAVRSWLAERSSVAPNFEGRATH